MWSEYIGVLLLVTVTTLLWFWMPEGVSSKAEVGRPKVKQLGWHQSLTLLFKLVRNRAVPLCELLLDFSRQFGNVLVVRNPINGQVYCFLADMPLAKSIMSSPGWMNRLPSKHYTLDYSWGKPLGIIFGNDGYWKEGRKLTLKLLHKLDFFRMENMENFISFEAAQIEKEFLGAIQASGGEEAVMTVHRMFEIYTLNVVLQVIMGKRFERSNPTVESLLSALHAANTDFNIGTGILDALPWLRHLPGLKFNKTTQHCLNTLHGYFQKELLEPKRKSGSYRTSPVDFADHFLWEIDRRSGEDPRYLTDENFLSCMRDLVFGGSDTTNSVLEHVILHVSLQPAIQSKVQDEIDQVIGARGPTYEDRLRMPYTQALIWETLRYAAPVPVASRVPLTDRQISSGEVVVPKDTLVVINIHAIHHSEEIWGNPGQFRPERFLNGNRQELINVDKIMPFGYGKRVCIGESVGKITLFIFVSSLLQKFTFELSKSHPPPTMKNQMGLGRAPFPYYVKVRPRALPDGATACPVGTE